MRTIPDLRWGLVAPAPRTACLHCGRPGVHHAGACWTDPVGRFLDGALAK